MKRFVSVLMVLFAFIIYFKVKNPAQVVDDYIISHNGRVLTGIRYIDKQRNIYKKIVIPMANIKIIKEDNWGGMNG